MPIGRMMWGWGMAASVIGLLVTAIVVGLVVWAVIAATQSGSPPPDDPRRILDQRFARGEIDADEYQERRRLLDQLG